MENNSDIPKRDQWARFRFSVIGPLLSAPPQKGELRAELERLARKLYKNPITGEVEHLSQEDIMTLALIKKARNGDATAYQKLMDSGYGLPTQQIDVTTERPIFNGIDLNAETNNGTKQDSETA